MYKTFSSIDDLYREMEADKHWTGADSGFRNRYPVRFVLFENFGDFGDFVDVGLALVGKFRVKRPGAEKKAGVGGDERFHLAELVVLAADDESGCHAGRLHAADDGVAVFVEGAAVEVAV